MNVGLGVDFGGAGELAVDPRFDPDLVQLLPRRGLVETLGADPDRWSGLDRLEQFQILHLGRTVARRHRQMLAEPVGEQPPRVGRHHPSLVDPFPALAPPGPVRGIADREQPPRVAANRPGPDPADRMDRAEVKQTRQEQSRLDPVLMDRVDPPLPAEQGEHGAADESVVGRGQVAAEPQRPGQGTVGPPFVLQDRPLHDPRDRDRLTGQDVDRHHMGDGPRLDRHRGRPSRLRRRRPAPPRPGIGGRRPGWTLLGRSRLVPRATRRRRPGVAAERAEVGLPPWPALGRGPGADAWLWLRTGGAGRSAWLHGRIGVFSKRLVVENQLI